MRQGQQHRRGRGRVNHNPQRKGQNPLTRSFESNGPDVKIRGTPAHIAEKYISLARDALSSGDPVLAENYLQHAEHYNRIIMTYREQSAPNGQDGFNGHNRHRNASSADFDGADDMDDDDGDVDAPAQHPPRGFEPQPQPRQSAPQRYDDRGERPERQDRPERQERQERGGDRHDRSDRQPRHERGERHERQQDRQQFRNRDHHQHSARADAVRHDPGRAEQPVIPMGEPVAAVHASPARAEGGRPERSERPERADRGGERAPGRRPPQRFDRETQEQPEFLRRPVRRPRRDAAEAGDGEAPARDAEEKPVA